MLVLIRWHSRNVSVPLSHLIAVDVHKSTDEAIRDWRYWVAQGYVSESRTPVLLYARLPKAYEGSGR